MHERKEKNKRFDENFKNTNIYHIHARWKRQKRIIKKNIPLLLLLQKKPVNASRVDPSIGVLRQSRWREERSRCRGL